MTTTQTQLIAQERVKTLFNLAEQAFRENPQQAQRYVELARKIAMRARIRLPRELRRRVCRRCNAYLVPGATSRTRIRQEREPHVAVTCLRCGAVTRIPLGGEKT